MPAFRNAAAVAAWLALPPMAEAAEPVRHIGIYVQPYYEAARTREAAPRVAVGKSFDALLASTRREDIEAARDKAEAQPKHVTPMTLMVLAIRLYDMGLRDDAVFWFYVAKARYITLEDVIDVRAAGLVQAAQAVKSFAVLAGPTINGYAYCDPGKQHATLLRAIDWAEKNPYAVIHLMRLNARPGDRTANLKKSIQSQRDDAERERAQMTDKKFAADFVAARKRNDADGAYCCK